MLAWDSSINDLLKGKDRYKLSLLSPSLGDANTNRKDSEMKYNNWPHNNLITFLTGICGRWGREGWQGRKRWDNHFLRLTWTIAKRISVPPRGPALLYLADRIY